MRLPMLVLPAVGLCLAGVLSSESAEPPASRWEGAIRAFEEADRRQPPPKDAVLFVGSSSIRMWSLEDSFPGTATINRGFGGSQIADSTKFANRIVLPHAPKVIVLYAGDNDVAAGKTPPQVADDYERFVATIRPALPKARIVFIAVKPSISRWKLVDKMRQANRLIRTVTETDPLQIFVDIDTPMIGTDGKPRAELFKSDGLHLNAQGYKLWAELVGPHLKIP